MNRRQVLRLGWGTLIASLGGCTSIGDQQEASAFSLSMTGAIPVEIQKTEFTRSYPGQEPFAEIVCGEISSISNQLHGVEIYNNTDDSVDISLTVNREVEEGILVLEGEGTIAVEEYIVLAISRPATYLNNLTVNAEDVDLEKTFEVQQSVWDASQSENAGLPPEHNVHIKRNEINVKLVGEER